MMRTTLNLPDDVYDVARSLAATKQISIGDAIAELVRRGLSPPRASENPVFPQFILPPDSAPVTLQQTLDADDEA